MRKEEYDDLLKYLLTGLKENFLEDYKLSLSENEEFCIENFYKAVLPENKPVLKWFKDIDEKNETEGYFYILWEYFYYNINNWIMSYSFYEENEYVTVRHIDNLYRLEVLRTDNIDLDADNINIKSILDKILD